MSWLVYGISLLIVAAVIYRNRFFHLPGLPRTATVWFFALKLVAAIAIWYVYTYYYPQREYADIWKYFDDSEVLYSSLDANPGDYFRMMSGVGIDDRIQHTYIDRMQHWDQQFENNLFNDSHTIIRFNALLRLISGGNYHTHALFMCLLAFIGLCALYRWIYPYLYQWKKLVAFVLFVSPSLLFWSSGVLKEGILFFALGLLIYHGWKFGETRKRVRLFWVALSIVLLAMTKLYMLVFILPPLALGMYLHRHPRFALAKTLAVFGLMLGIGILVHIAKPSFSPFRIIAMKQHDFLNLARGGTYLVNNKYVVYLRPDQRQRLKQIDSTHYHIGSGTQYIYWSIADNFKDTLYEKLGRDTITAYTILNDSPVANSLMSVRKLEPTPLSVLSEAPAALGRSIFRPDPFEISNALMIPPLLENVFTYLLVLFMLLASKKASSRSVFWFCLCYVIIALTVTGLTTPVLGALVRYRITAIPFLIFAILLCTDRQKLVRRWPVLDRIL